MTPTAPILLISLGTSQAVVPEAFLFPDATFAEVHVLTTANTEVDIIRDWFRAYSDVQLSITRVDGFDKLESEEDHNRFEEVLFRWYQHRSEGRRPYVCLAGGYKTMSSAIQKAASLFGAEEVFHVLCTPLRIEKEGKQKEVQPCTIAEIRDAWRDGRIHWIRQGPEAGWPQFRSQGPDQFPLQLTPIDSVEFRANASDFVFRKRVAEVLRQSHHIAGAWDQIASLPFPHLATWAPQDLNWLNQPVDHEADRPWIQNLPKVELHCHLGGFATEGDELFAVRAAALTPLVSVPQCPSPIPGWPLPNRLVPLDEYRNLGNANGTALLKDPGCLQKQCELLYAHLQKQRVLYAEIRCSPANYSSLGRSPWQVLADIRQHFERCMDAARGLDRKACHVNLIIIGTRQATGDYRASISRHLALAISAAEHQTSADQCRVVGVDLAGYEEKETRAHYFREEFTGIHRCGLALTVHAGENDDAEGIWRAVFDLNTRRLGHALSLKESPPLMRSVGDRGVGVEMCPYANCQIKGFRPEGTESLDASVGLYPLKVYLDQGIRVTVNTDNVGISSATLSDNLILAARLCPNLTRLDILRLQANAIHTAFISVQEQQALSRCFASRIPLPRG